MRLLHAVHGFPPEPAGGTERYVARLAEAQAAAGDEVAVLAGSRTPAAPPALVEEPAGGVRVFRYRGWPGRREHWSEVADPDAEALVRGLLAGFRPDLLHVHHWLRLSTRLAGLAAEAGIPSVVTLHETWSVCPRIFRLRGDLSYCEEPYRPDLCVTCAPREPWQDDREVTDLLAERHRRVTGELAAAARLVVPSESHRRVLARATGLPAERFDLLPHPSMTALVPAPPPEPPPVRIGCLGALAPHKGQDVLLRALGRLPAAPAWELHLFGEDADPGFAAECRALAGGLPVRFHGAYAPEALATAGLHLAVFPSLAPESFAFTLDEALALGLPLVVSDRGALAERAGEAALVVPAGDPAALADAVRRLLEAPALRARLAAAARARPPGAAWDGHLAGLAGVYRAARSRPVASPPPADDAALGRIRYRQVLARDARLAELAAARRERDHALAAHRLLTASRAWAALSLLREVRRLHRLTPEGRRAAWRLLRRCLGPARPAEQQYQAWLALHRPDAPRLERWREDGRALGYRPLVSVLTPVYDVAERWLVEAIESVRAQVYENWELCLVDDASPSPHVRAVLAGYAGRDPRIRVATHPARQGIVGASNTALGLARGEFVALLDHDDELAPHALHAVVTALNRDRATDLVYTDEDKVDETGRRFEPAFKPDWSPDLFRSFNYLGHLCVLRADLVRKLGGFRPGFEGSQDYDLLLRVSEATERIAHVPDVLYSWRTLPGSTAGSLRAKGYAYEAAARALAESLERRGTPGRVERPAPGRYTVRYAVRGAPLVSVVVPMRDRAALTRRCFESLERRTRYVRWEVVVVDNGSVEPATARLLAGLGPRYRVVRHDAPFNFSALVNVGARAARGDYLLLLNNDTEVIEPEWMTALLEHAQRPEVGAAGGQLLYPDGRLQHAGAFIMGTPTAVAGHRFKFLPARDPGYLGIPRMIGNVSAVTAACLMVARPRFLALGGFDEAFRVAFGDVDFCLRLRAQGLLIVYTPVARLYHHESATRGSLHPPDDDRLFRRRWRPYFEGRRDPYWNPNLSAETEFFGLAL